MNVRGKLQDEETSSQSVKYKAKSSANKHTNEATNKGGRSSGDTGNHGSRLSPNKSD